MHSGDSRGFSYTISYTIIVLHVDAYPNVLWSNQTFSTKHVFWRNIHPDEVIFFVSHASSVNEESKSRENSRWVKGKGGHMDADPYYYTYYHFLDSSFTLEACEKNKNVLNNSRWYEWYE